MKNYTFLKVSNLISCIFCMLLFSHFSFSQGAQPMWRLEGNSIEQNNFIGTINNQALVFKSNGIEGFRLLPNGNVGIGTGDPEYKLDVCGIIRATEVIIEPQWWPDFVFHDDYVLQPFNERMALIKQTKHLPGLPSEKSISTYGANMNEVIQGLLKNMEELYLYIEKLENRIKELEINIEESVN